MRLPDVARTLIMATALAAAAFVLALTRTDVDLWGHVRFGLDIVDARGLHATDPYSFTADRPWVNHEWLAEVVFGLAWRYAGTAGLIAVKLACALGALGLMALTLRESGVRRESSLFLLGLALLAILPRVGQIRPQLFSVVLFSALIYVFVRSRRTGTGTLAWTIPIVALWANFHGGWLVGAGTAVAWCAGEAFASRHQKARAGAALLAGLAALAISLVNPYGPGLWAFLLETVRFGRQDIREWGPVWTSPAAAIVWVLFMLILGGAVRGLQSFPRNPATVLLPAGLALAALRVSRLDAFFAMSVIGLLARPVASLFETRHARRSAPAPPAALLVGIAVLALVVMPPARRAFTCIGFLDSRWPEPDAAAFMKQQRLSGRLVTYFDWGEYAIWHLAPALKVSMDGRRETVYSSRVIDGHLALYAGAPEGLAYLRSLDADYAWFPRQLPAVAALEELGWVSLFEGPQSRLLAKPGTSVVPQAFLASGTMPRRCFPGP